MRAVRVAFAEFDADAAVVGLVVRYRVIGFAHTFAGELGRAHGHIGRHANSRSRNADGGCADCHHGAAGQQGRGAQAKKSPHEYALGIDPVKDSGGAYREACHGPLQLSHTTSYGLVQLSIITHPIVCIESAHVLLRTLTASYGVVDVL